MRTVKKDQIELIHQLKPGMAVKMSILRYLKEKRRINIIAEETHERGYF